MCALEKEFKRSSCVEHFPNITHTHRHKCLRLTPRVPKRAKFGPSGTFSWVTCVSAIRGSLDYSHSQLVGEGYISASTFVRNCAAKLAGRAGQKGRDEVIPDSGMSDLKKNTHKRRGGDVNIKQDQITCTLAVSVNVP